MSPLQQPALRIAGALLASTAAFTALPLSVAHAAPGDNGDVKIHSTTTGVDDERDEPKVCAFYLDAFNFDTVQVVSWTIDQQPPTGNAQVLAGSIVLTTGHGRTNDLSLPDGHYKLNWTFVGENGSGKHKVFDVQCASASPTAPPGNSPSPTASASKSASASAPPSGSAPSGPAAAGGGGGTRGPEVAEIAAGSALLAVAAGLGLRAVRRRSSRDAES